MQSMRVFCSSVWKSPEVVFGLHLIICNRSVVEELERIGEPVERAIDYARSQCEIIDDSAFSGTPSEVLVSFLGMIHFISPTSLSVSKSTFNDMFNLYFRIAGKISVKQIFCCYPRC